MKLIQIYANGIVRDQNGLRLDFPSCKSAEAIARKCKQILPRERYLVPDRMNASPEQASIEIEAARGRPELTERCLRDAIGLIVATHTLYVQRYRDAIAANRPVQRTDLDSAIECLNKTVWAVQQAGGITTLAPERDFATVLHAVDPATLRANAPNNAEDVAIDGALIIGCREIHDNQRDLFRGDEQVEVIISLVDAVPEVRLRTTRAEAQQLYRGANRLSAAVRVNGRGNIPEVVGEYMVGEQ